MTQGDGKKLTKFFSVKTHGEEMAKELAIAQRRKQLEQVRAARGSDTASPPGPMADAARPAGEKQP